jgi:hypothetical protein
MSNLLETIFFVLAACYVVEQVFYRVAGSYPYRHGFVVKTISLSVFDLYYWDSIKYNTGALMVKIQMDKGEVYFRYKYPYGAIGPLLFLGQIKKTDTASVLQIKVGPLSTVFVAFLIAYPFVSLDVLKTPMFQAMNLLCLAAVIAFFYFALLMPIRGAIEAQNDNRKQ